MPTYKKRTKKRRHVPVAQRAMTMVRRVKREVEGDLKYGDFQNTGTSIGNTFTVFPITDFPAINDTSVQPTMSNARVSYYSILKKLHGRCNLNLAGSATQPVSFRLMLVIDKEVSTTSSSPIGSDILAASGDVNSPLNRLNTKRFKILWDKKHYLCPNGVQGMSLKFFKKMTLKIGSQFSQSSQTYNPRENNIYLCILGDTNATGLNDIGFSYYFRSRFIDI